MRTLVEEAVREYLESAAITDLEPTQVAEAQAALLGELHNMLTVPPPLEASDGACDASKLDQLNQAIKAALDVR